jgi:hypothetical protein
MMIGEGVLALLIIVTLVFITLEINPGTSQEYLREPSGRQLPLRQQ